MWSVFAALIFVVVATPALTLFAKLFDASGPQWDYVAGRLFSNYVASTVVLLVGVALITVLVGVSIAWLVSSYEFPGRKWFEWLLILPLAFPAYMMAYSYVGILEYTGPIHTFFRNTLDIHITGPIVDVMNIGGAIFVLSMSLFPYVYIMCRASFIRRSRDVQDAALLLGSNQFQTFLRVALPMARPAIVAGLALVSMEVLNDYGTVKYYGVDTFTTGIFRAWFSMGDVSTGIRLSAMLILVVITLIWLERRQRGKRAWVPKSGNYREPFRIALNGVGRIVAVVICLGVLLLSFILPLGQLIYWVNMTAHKIMDRAFWQLAANSFMLALFAAALIVMLAIVLLYAARITRYSLVRYVSSLAILGYAVPGAVIAIGIQLPIVAIDRWLVQLVTGSGGLYLSLTLFMLVFAYVVRFMAVGYNAVDAGFQKSGIHVHEVSRTLGASTWRTLVQVDMPLIRNSIVAALLLVFVDIIKELPLTLILRPFNFHTLATKAFDLATNEQVAESANASLLVLCIGVIPVILLNNLIKNK